MSRCISNVVKNSANIIDVKNILLVNILCTYIKGNDIALDG